MTYRTLGALAALLATESAVVNAACDTSLVNLLGNGTAVLKTNCGAGVTVKSVDWKRALNGAAAQSLTGVVALTPNVTSTDIYYRTPIMSGTATYTVEGIDAADTPIAVGAAATFTTIQPTLTVLPSLGGTISSAPTGINSCTSTGGTCAATYSAGTFVTLTATPTTGYTFAGWGGDCSIDGSTCAIDVMGPQLVTASFTQNAAGAPACPVTAPTPSAPTATCTIGTPSSVTTGTSDYRWTCTSGSSTATCIAPRQYTVSTGAVTNGTISPASRTTTYGKTATFTVTPNSGYVAVPGGTCPTGTLVGTTYTTGVITSACSVDINFQTNPPVAAVCTNETPTLTAPTPACSTGTVESGTFAEGTASWTWNCLGLYGGAPDACVAPRQYTVSASAGSNGTISPSGSTARTVTYNNATTFTVTPSPGYAASVSVSGSCSAGSLSGTTYTTGAVTGGTCAVSATFAATSGCGSTPTNYTVLDPGSSFGGDTWEPYNPAATLNVTLSPQQGLALGFNMANLTSAYPFGFLVQNLAGGSFAFYISACPGSTATVLNQTGTSSVDVNLDGRTDRCDILGMYGRYNNNSSGSDNFYNNTDNLSTQTTCFLPTTSGGSSAYYYINVINTSTTTSRALQYKNLYQSN